MTGDRAESPGPRPGGKKQAVGSKAVGGAPKGRHNVAQGASPGSGERPPLFILGFEVKKRNQMAKGKWQKANVKNSESGVGWAAHFF